MRRNISLTSWVFPSPTTTLHHEFIPVAVVRTNSTSCGTTRWPSSTVPLASFAPAVPSGTPLTFARYSRRTP